MLLPRSVYERPGNRARDSLMPAGASERAPTPVEDLPDIAVTILSLRLQIVGICGDEGFLLT